MILNHIISLCYRCITNLLSCDLYCKEDEIKEYEWQQRNSILQSDPFIVIGGSAIPKWSPFIDLPENKRNLNEFICNYIESRRDKLPQGLDILISGGYSDPSITKKLSRAEVTVLDDMRSNQLESECRIFSY